MRESRRVVLTDLGEQLMEDAMMWELVRFAEQGAWFRFEDNGDGTWTVYTGLARGNQWPDPDK